MNSNFNEIIDRLFIGNSRSTEEYEFDLVVNCTKDIPFPTTYSPHCVRIAIYDDPYESESMIRQITETGVLEQIHHHITNKKTVLVHCLMGMQRSCALVACYLIRYKSLDIESAIHLIRSKRPVAFLGHVNLWNAIDAFYKNTDRWNEL